MGRHLGAALGHAAEGAKATTQALGMGAAHGYPTATADAQERETVSHPSANGLGQVVRDRWQSQQAQQSLPVEAGRQESTMADTYVVPTLLSEQSAHFDEDTVQSLHQAYMSGEVGRLNAAVYQAVQSDPAFARMREALLEEYGQ